MDHLDTHKCVSEYLGGVDGDLGCWRRIIDEIDGPFPYVIDVGGRRESSFDESGKSRMSQLNSEGEAKSKGGQIGKQFPYSRYTNGLSMEIDERGDGPAGKIYQITGICCDHDVNW